MNILYHHRTQGHGAEGVHITEIIKGMRKKGHEVVLVSPPGVDPFSTAGTYLYGAKKSFIGRLWKTVSRYAPQIVFELMELGYSRVQKGKLEKVLREKDFSFIYERYAFFLSCTAELSEKHGIPLIVEVNEISGIKRARPLILKGLAQRIEKKVFTKAARVITVSSFLKQRIAEMGVDPDKIIVMPNGVDQEKFSPSADGTEVRRQYGLDGSVVLGFVGWIDPWDNLPGLLEVLKSLTEKRKDVKLLLVGDVAGKGVDPNYVANYVRKLGLSEHVVHVRRVPRPDMPRHIAAMDVCVIPDSNPFGSPVALFEFMGLGKAVVAPSLLPITDVITHGRNGMVFEAHNQDSLKKALAEVIDNPALRASMGLAARRDVETKHNWEKNAEGVLNAYAALPRKAAAK